MSEPENEASVTPASRPEDEALRQAAIAMLLTQVPLINLAATPQWVDTQARKPDPSSLY